MTTAKEGYNWPKATPIHQRRFPFVLTTNTLNTGTWTLCWSWMRIQSQCSWCSCQTAHSWHEACWFRTLQLVQPAMATDTANSQQATANKLLLLQCYEIILFNNKLQTWIWSAIVAVGQSALIAHEKLYRIYYISIMYMGKCWHSQFASHKS